MCQMGYGHMHCAKSEAQMPSLAYFLDVVKLLDLFGVFGETLHYNSESLVSQLGPHIRVVTVVKVHSDLVD